MRSEAITLKNWFRSFKSRINPHEIDSFLLITVIALLVFGLIMVYSASFIFAQERTGDGLIFVKKQVVFAVIGIIAMVAGFKIPYQIWNRWAFLLLGVVLVLLVLVMVPGLGASAGGARRWLKLGPVNFQPSELAKLIITFFASYQLVRKTDRLHSFSASVISPFLLPAGVFVLLLMQPDFGAVVMCTMVIFSLMFVAGVPKRFLAITIIVASVAGTLLAFAKPYRMERILTFMNPWRDPDGKGFQIIQSLVGFNNGSFFGVGLGNGKEKLFFLPEAHNDFIFAVIGEEMGFLGVIILVFAYLFFIYRGLKIAWLCREIKQDSFGFLLATGITLLIGVQAFINMMVVMGLLPTKGLTLPFISYGGSALIINLFSIGILLNISKLPRLISRQEAP